MRVTLLVLDSVGMGAMPDAEEWGDAGSDTIGHVADAVGGLSLPNLEKMGLGNIRPIRGVSAVESPTAGYGKAAIASAGKDTVSGHWEMAGVPVTDPFRTFPEGFPPAIMDAFHQAIGRQSLGNFAASGTQIIEDLGEEHRTTGKPIVYTSADSVFQIAAHEDVVPVDLLFRWCEAAFDIVVEYGVARVIARPFVGEQGAYTRTHNRHDYSLVPPARTIMDILQDAGEPTTSVGKVKSVFGGRGFTESIAAGGNAAILQGVLDQLDRQTSGMIFANLVDFDMLYGHRRNPQGYARALEAFDERLPDLVGCLGADDLLILTADHGNDPTWVGTDHTREYVPILAWHAQVRGLGVGTRTTMADIGATIADWFRVPAPETGESFLPQL